MTSEQFRRLREDLQAYVIEICTKLEQIRREIIDVEIKVEKVINQKSN